MELPNRLTGLVNLRNSSAQASGVVDNVPFRDSQSMGWGCIIEKGTRGQKKQKTPSFLRT